MSVDIETLRARNEARRSGTAAAGPSFADVDDLLRALEAARAELHQITEDDADLRASAQLWADLYAASVDRANATEALLKELVSAPEDVRRCHGMVDAIAVLAEALESVLVECAECAGAGAPSWRALELEQARSRWCERCVKAVDALRATIDLRR